MATFHVLLEGKEWADPHENCRDALTEWGEAQAAHPDKPVSLVRRVEGNPIVTDLTDKAILWHLSWHRTWQDQDMNACPYWLLDAMDRAAMLPAS